MKAHVKATGEIVEVTACGGWMNNVETVIEYRDTNGNRYTDKDLHFGTVAIAVASNTELDYWTRLEHQYAGMAMQGMIRTVGHDRMYPPEKIAIYAEACAHALIQKLKEKEERK